MIDELVKSAFARLQACFWSIETSDVLVDFQTPDLYLFALVPGCETVPDQDDVLLCWDGLADKGRGSSCCDVCTPWEQKAKHENRKIC